MSANNPPPPTTPMPTPSNPAPKQQGSNGGVGWIVGTAIFAITTVIAIAWGVSRTSDLQDQVDALNSQLSQQTQSSQTAQTVADSQIAQLESDIVTLEAALDGLQKVSGTVLKSVNKEYVAVENQLQATQAAADELKKERDASEQDAAAITDSYAKTQQELALTQEALAQLLQAVAVELAEDPTS